MLLSAIVMKSTVAYIFLHRSKKRLVSFQLPVQDYANQRTSPFEKKTAILEMTAGILKRIEPARILIVRIITKTTHLV